MLTTLNSLRKQNNDFPLKYFKQKDIFSKTTLLLYNGTVVLIVIFFFAKDLFYITKQICQLLRKFFSFLLQMMEGEIISCFKCKVGMIKISA